MTTARLALAYVIALALSACSSGSPGTIAISADQLGLMALTRQDLGPAFVGFVLDPAQSGTHSPEQLVERSVDPGDEARDVERFGHQAAVTNTYIDMRSRAIGGGSISYSEQIVLFGSTAGASGDLADALEDVQRQFSGTTQAGSLQAYQTFATRVGDESYGAVMRFLTRGEPFGLRGNVNLTLTVVGFRRDRLTASLVLARLDARDVHADVIEAAEKLDRRIMSVLRGDVMGTADGVAP